jgi:hypothetical protein
VVGEVGLDVHWGRVGDQLVQRAPYLAAGHCG